MNELEEQVRRVQKWTLENRNHQDKYKWDLVGAMANACDDYVDGIDAGLLHFIESSYLDMGFYDSFDFDLHATKEEYEELFRRLKKYAKLHAFT